MLKPARILVVDDEVRITESLGRLLEGRGHHVFAVNSGQEAQDLLSRQQIDIALLDMMMPDMSGLELMDYINVINPDIPVIFITGHSSLDTAILALKNGAYDYIKKPFEHEKILKSIQNALYQKSLKNENNDISKKLTLSEKRYKYLVQSSPDIIYTLDNQANFTFVSDVIESMLGYNRNQLLGKRFTTIVNDKDLKKAQLFLEETRSGKISAPGIELNMKTKNGSNADKICEIRQLNVNLNSRGKYAGLSLNENKRCFESYGVITDISERKRLEAELQHAQKMEAVGTLAGGVAHDFNNLLMVIQGLASLMLLKTDSDHFNYRKLCKIEEYVQKGSDLTKQLLNFAREGLADDLKPVNLNKVVEQTAEMFGRTRKNITVQYEFEKDIWAVAVDQGQIEQVLMNLFTNASHAMSRGGDLVIRTKNVTLDDSSVISSFDFPPGEYVRLSVADKGEGMDDETQARIFDPFFTTKEVGKGTGLGLSNAYGIIKNHKGFIKVNSKEGEGTTFNIFLPVSKMEIKEEVHDDTTQIEQGPETVLLVDDEKMIVEVGTEILEVLGYDVLRAESGSDAVSLYETNKDDIDVVLLDIIMPGMDGRETLDRIKKIDPEVKSIFISGYSADGEGSQIPDLDCDKFIQKPFNVKALSRKLREVLDSVQS
jgi:PAS domain S-box-containing protein